MGPDAGVAAVCAVAGVVPALPRGEGGAGAVGERQQCVHVGVRGIGGVSGAGDGPDRPVSRLLGISWVTVGSIVERVVARRLDGARFAKLRRIGIDEFSYRKRHRPRQFSADVTEHPVLDLVPFARARWKMAHRDLPQASVVFGRDR